MVVSVISALVVGARLVTGVPDVSGLVTVSFMTATAELIPVIVS